MQYEGRVWRYGDDINTDVLIPARYLSTSDPAELAKHALEDLDATFVRELRPGEMIVGGKNFGCGSSREHAPIAIKAAGVSCVIASSFARIFFRNSINLGLPILECPEAVEHAEKGDILMVDLAAGTIFNETTGQTYQARPFPEAVMKIIRAGGLMASIKDEATARGAEYASAPLID
jgi:3-isopropylmalate/(R)-2-methylmalate dehydratase small subunit